MKYFLFLLCFILSIAVKAQTKLTIKYQYGLPNDDSSSPKVAAVLAVKNSVSYYYPISDATEVTDPGDSRLGASFQAYGVYTDYSKGYSMLQVSPMGRGEYIIKDSLHIASWQLKNDFERIVAGYTCKKAFAYINNKKITVFYSPELPPAIGPGIVSNLPGTILEVWYEGQAKVLAAKEVILNKVDEIMEPADGKIVSYDKFDKILSRVNFQTGFTYDTRSTPGNDNAGYGYTNNGHVNAGYGNVDYANACYGNASLLPINSHYNNYYYTRIPGISRPSTLPVPGCCYVQPSIDINRTLPMRYDPNLPRANGGAPWVQ